MTSPIHSVLIKLKELWEQKTENGRYYVRRGPINFASFQFDRFPRAVAIICDDSSLPLPQEQFPFQGARISFEIGMSMPDEASGSIDDEAIDALRDDCTDILLQLLEATDTEGDNIVLRIDLGQARVIEWHDADRNLQGVILSFTLDS